MGDLAARLQEAYAVRGESIEVGRALIDGEVAPEAAIRFPLKTANRHGLVAGATGTGKTTTLRTLAEQLSAAGVSVFATDVKGDLSGLAAKGDKGTWVEERLTALGETFEPQAFPVEYYSLGGLGAGAPIRVTVSDFGPLLLAKILDANKTQEQSLSLLFHYADQKGLPLVDLSDLRAMLQFLDSEEGRIELKGIGGVSPATVGVLLRALVQVEDGGGNELFGEPQLDINDLIRTDPEGRGVISLLELGDVRDKPLLWSTATMWLLGELFETLPEVGDLPKPKLVFFFDEAHLLFKDASKAFVEAVVGTARLIRSKGVGVFFVTQTPKDVHGDVLAQLGAESNMRSAPTRPTTRRRSAQPCAPTRSRRTTTWSSCCLSSRSARRWSRCSTSAACRRPSPIPASVPRGRSSSRWGTWPKSRKPPLSTRSTGRASTRRARERCSPSASSRQRNST